MMEFLKSLGTFLLDVLETVAIALAIFVISYIVAFQPHKVQGDSMLPYFHNGDFLLTDKLTYRFREPARGEVVIFKYPKDPRYDYIKRIIALPGEKIKIEDNKITVYNASHPQGITLKESYLGMSIITLGKKFIPDGVTIEIPQDSYIALGDNRTSSSDSRDWGPVTRDKIIGRAFFRYWPLQSLSFVAKAQYNTD